MKELTKKQISEMSTAIEATYTQSITIEDLIINGKTFKCEIYTSLPMSDIYAIASEIALATTIKGDVDQFNFSIYLAKCVVDYLTNISLPMMKDSNGEDVIDLNACYVIYTALSRSKDWDKLEIIGLLHKMALDISKNGVSTTTEKLCQKILDLYEISKTYLKDLSENPADLLSFLDNLGLSSEDTIEKSDGIITPFNNDTK